MLLALNFSTDVDLFSVFSAWLGAWRESGRYNLYIPRGLSCGLLRLDIGSWIPYEEMTAREGQCERRRKFMASKKLKKAKKLQSTKTLKYHPLTPR